MRILLNFLLILLLSCHSSIVYPPGGYDYPKNVRAEDTNFYYLPIKDIESKRYAFENSYHFLFYRSFNEPNLSLKPLETEVFRFTFISVSDDIFIITLRENALTVKAGNMDDVYTYDSKQGLLTEEQKLQLGFLNSNYPIDTAAIDSSKSRYRYYMVKQYPQLLDPGYYKMLKDKTLIMNPNSVMYTTSEKRISVGTYYSLVKQINKSGYWKMPIGPEEIDGCYEQGGGVFHMEANTKTKYKYVEDRTCPDTTRFRKACQALIDEAELGEKIKVYRKE
ncbi:MAG: hypothetical protein ABIX01_09360 [Chitinophagaceae bacterium]